MRYGREYVLAEGEMYRVVAREHDGKIRYTAGPYATKAAAMRQRKRYTRPDRVVSVEVCHPEWLPVEGTEL